MSIVYCETPEHPDRPHAEGYGNTACTWPHEVGPSGPQPVVGHPYTIHD